MHKTISKKQRNCVLAEKEIAIKAIKECDLNFADNNEERRRCRRKVAKESGIRGRECVNT